MWFEFIALVVLTEKRSVLSLVITCLSFWLIAAMLHSLREIRWRQGSVFYFRRFKADFQSVMVVFMWARCPCGEYLQRGAVYDTDQQSLMKIRPGYGLTALSLSVCSGPCLSLALGTAYDSSQFHHGFWGFGMLGFKWQVCALLLPTSGFRCLLSFLDNKSASPPSYDDYIFMTVSSYLHWYFGLLTIQFSLNKEL